MARTLIPASNPGLLLTANQDHVLGQSPILKPTQLRMDDDTQAALLEQALDLYNFKTVARSSPRLKSGSPINASESPISKPWR